MVRNHLKSGIEVSKLSNGYMIYMDFFVLQIDLYGFVWIPPNVLYVYLSMNSYGFVWFKGVSLSALWYLGSRYIHEAKRVTFQLMQKARETLPFGMPPLTQ